MRQESRSRKDRLSCVSNCASPMAVAVFQLVRRRVPGGITQFVGAGLRAGPRRPWVTGRAAIPAKKRYDRGGHMARSLTPGDSV